MDAMTATIVWGVLWFVLIGAFPVIGFLLGGIISIASDADEDLTTMWAFLGWVVGGAAAVFALIQFILQIVSFVKLLT